MLVVVAEEVVWRRGGMMAVHAEVGAVNLDDSFNARGYVIQ